jgi:hypothetical protein
MTTERFINQASAGWTTYGTSRVAFHCFRASHSDMNDPAEELKNAERENEDY